jgi:hypothetical protein
MRPDQERSCAHIGGSPITAEEEPITAGGSEFEKKRPY